MILSSELRLKGRLLYNVSSCSKNTSLRRTNLTNNLKHRSRPSLIRTKKISRRRNLSGSSTRERKRNAFVKRPRARLTPNSMPSSSSSSLRRTRRLLAFNKRRTVSSEITSGNSSRNWTRRRKHSSRVTRESDAHSKPQSKNVSTLKWKSSAKSRARCSSPREPTLTSLPLRSARFRLNSLNS